jgi:hypothetical protein
LLFFSTSNAVLIIFNADFFKQLQDSKGGNLFNEGQPKVLELITEYAKQIDILTNKQINDKNIIMKNNENESQLRSIDEIN